MTTKNKKPTQSQVDAPFFPINFKIGESFEEFAAEHGLDFQTNLTIISYNKQGKKIIEEEVKLNDELNFQIVPKQEICYYNYQIGKMIEDRKRQFTYSKHQFSQKDEWNKQMLSILFKISLLPEMLILSLSVLQDDQSFFVQNLSLVKNASMYNCFAYIPMQTTFILIKFKLISMNEQPDSVAELKINVDHLKNECNYLVFCLEETDLNAVLKKLEQKENQEEQKDKYFIKIFHQNFIEESQKEVIEIQKNIIKTKYIPQRVASANGDRAPTIVHEIPELRSLKLLNERNLIKLKQRIQKHANIAIQNEMGLQKFKNVIMKDPKLMELSPLINDMEKVTKQLLRKLNQIETTNNYQQRITELKKDKKEIIDTLTSTQEKLVELKNINKQLAEEIEKYKNNKELQLVNNELQQTQTLLIKSDEKIKDLLEQIKNLELANEELQKQLKSLQKYNDELKRSNQTLSLTNDQQGEKHNKEVFQLIERLRLFQDLCNKLKEKQKNQDQNVESGKEKQNEQTIQTPKQNPQIQEDGHSINQVDNYQRKQVEKVQAKNNGFTLPPIRQQKNSNIPREERPRWKNN